MFRCGRTFLTFSAIVACSMLNALLPYPIQAEESQGAPAQVEPAKLRSAEVSLGGVTVCRFTESYRGVTPFQRVNAIYQRIWHVIDATSFEERGNLPSQVRVNQLKGDFVVLAGGQVIITVDEAHARINKTSPRVLAEMWAGNLQRALQSYNTINAPIAPPINASK